MTGTRDHPYPSGRYTAYVVFVLWLAFAMAYLDRQIISLLLPSLKADLGVSDTQVSLIQGMAFASIYALAGLPMGWITDHTNRRNLLTAGVVIWSTATLACGLASSFGELFAARMAVGFGEACLAPACVSLVADYVRPDQRGRAVSTMMTGSSIGNASSLFLGGILLTSLTHGSAAVLLPQGWAPWQMIFIAFALPGLIVAVLVGSLKEPPRRQVKAQEVADVPKISFIEFLRRHPGATAVFFGLAACMSVVTYSVASWAPTVLMRIYGMEPTSAGAIYGSAMLVCGVAGGLCSGLVSDALIRRWELNGRMLIPLAALPVEIGVQTVVFFTTDAIVLIGALAASSFMLNFISLTFHAGIQDLFPNQLRGRAVALLGLTGSLVGLGCGPTLVAFVTDHVFQDEMMLQKSVALVALSAAAVAFLLACILPRLYEASRRKELSEEPNAAHGVAGATAALHA